MKDFVKYTLATITGLMLTGIVMGIFGIITLAGIAASQSMQIPVKNNSIMVINLNGTVTDMMVENPLATLLNEENTNLGVKDILESIEKAAVHENIKGIYLIGGALSAPPAALQEIRDALVKFKITGKPIVAYADSYTQGCYYLCSVADKLLLNPKGSIEWMGMSSQILFYKDLFDKVGVEMQVFKVGTYKSAVEPYIANSMSEANREQTTSFLKSIWEEIVKGVSTSRNIPVETLNEYADEMLTLRATTDYLEKGMVDTLMYESDVKQYLKTFILADNEAELNTLDLESMKLTEVPTSISNNVVAVYFAEGGIDDATSADEGINSKKVCRDLKKLREDDHIKAVVLRVNSPGGSAFGSEQIWHEVVELKAVKPVIVSMGGYAASGGYYISCAADKIIAEPTTLTGSIGIFGMVPNLGKLMNDKLGVHSDVVKTNPYADMGSLFRPFNEGERTLMQAEINRGYDLFITRCAEGRGMSKEAIMKIAEGRVWTGETAKYIGLVDELGGMETAIGYATEAAAIADDFRIVTYPEPETWLEKVLKLKKENFIRSQLQETFGEYYSTMQFIKHIGEQDKIQARMPFDMNINL